MKAENLVNDKIKLRDNAFAELVVWIVDEPVEGSSHNYKYRLALVIDQTCVMRYDNETGKGDHKHIGDNEIEFVFTSIEDLFVDFWTDVEELGI